MITSPYLFQFPTTSIILDILKHCFKNTLSDLLDTSFTEVTLRYYEYFLCDNENASTLKDIKPN